MENDIAPSELIQDTLKCSIAKNRVPIRVLDLRQADFDKLWKDWLISEIQGFIYVEKA